MHSQHRNTLIVCPYSCPLLYVYLCLPPLCIALCHWERELTWMIAWCRWYDLSLDASSVRRWKKIWIERESYSLARRQLHVNCLCNDDGSGIVIEPDSRLCWSTVPKSPAIMKESLPSVSITMIENFGLDARRDSYLITVVSSTKEQNRFSLWLEIRWELWFSMCRSLAMFHIWMIVISMHLPLLGLRWFLFVIWFHAWIRFVFSLHWKHRI